MCGINGIIFKNKQVDESIILKMNALLGHRGPDGSGYMKHKNLLLGHTRLSIMDLSEKGAQPMSVDGRYWIIYNGEIYNFLSIKNELIGKNYKFYSNTDTEVVLNAYKEWGLNCFEKFNGEWALCIFDKIEEKIIICRDGIGYKPCYIYNDKKYLAFSSEIKSLYPLNNNLEFDTQNIGIDNITLYNCCKTIFKNITQLPQGRLIVTEINNPKINIKRWDYPLNKLPKINSGFKENTKEYFDLLYNSTKIRLNSDVQTGTSLSGGLDSSSIFTLLNLIEKKEKLNKDNLDLRPIIMNYKEMKTIEDAKELSNKFGRKYNVLDFDVADIDNTQKLLTSLEIIEEYYMQYYLYKYQFEKGVKVSLDGHGADEFLGYPNWLPELSVDIFNNLINSYKTILKFGNTHNINRYKKLFGLGDKVPNIINFRTTPQINNIYNDYIYTEIFDTEYQVINDDIEELSNFSYELSFTYLMSYCGWFQYFLNKWDRASMSNSVEVRMPFLDNQVRLFTLSLSGNNKIRGGLTKSILRESFKDYFSSNMFNQNFKQGLKSQKFEINDQTIKFIKEILSLKEFKEMGCFKIDNITRDFEEGNNQVKVWNICKYFLMINGFKNKNDMMGNISISNQKYNNLVEN